MSGLIQNYSFSTVVIILLIAIPAIVNFITWCKGIWAKRETFKEDNIQKGREIEEHAEAEENRLRNGESRMTSLETDVADLKKIIEDQQKNDCSFN